MKNLTHTQQVNLIKYDDVTLETLKMIDELLSDTQETADFEGFIYE